MKDDKDRFEVGEPDSIGFYCFIAAIITALVLCIAHYNKVV